MISEMCFMGATMAQPAGADEQVGRVSCEPGGMMTKRTRSRWRRHAEELTRHAYRSAGPRTKVARARGKSVSALSHEVKDRVDPQLWLIVESLMDADGVTARGVVEALSDVVDLREIVVQDDEPFLARAVWLYGEENRTCFTEDEATAMGQREHAKSLRVHARVAYELSLYQDEAELRGFDIAAEWRAQKCPRAAGEPHRGRVPGRNNGKVTS